MVVGMCKAMVIACTAHITRVCGLSKYKIYAIYILNSSATYYIQYKVTYVIIYNDLFNCIYKIQQSLSQYIYIHYISIHQKSLHPLCIKLAV